MCWWLKILPNFVRDNDASAEGDVWGHSILIIVESNIEVLICRGPTSFI